MTWTITIRGRVQGVGFRPFVRRAALERNLNGWVVNGLEGVLIKINGTREQTIDFQQHLLKNAPETACVTASSVAKDENESFFDNFSICESSNDGLPVLHLTPDVALCAACRQEMHDPANRRFGYPFITCTVCGPRYSILTGVPYDRPLTTMRHFVMCAACKAEYEDPEDRRYYAQTNSCPVCGITLRLFMSETASDFTENTEDQEIVLQEVRKAWQRGAIVAIKGIGGYLLTCDATQAEAVARLRTRKHRPGKPFAMMYPDLDILQNDAEIPETARRHLQSPAAPIVLLEMLAVPASGFDRNGIAPGLSRIGAMLPNAPLFECLLQGFGKPIVATSANVSSAPLVYEDDAALRDLAGIADLVLSHNRPIVMPQDDSVVAVRASGESVILRRGRGWVPAFIQPGLQVPDTTVLALGAEMKSTFTLAHLGNINVSQYLGELGDFDTQQRFSQVQKHLTGLYKARPSIVAGDLHPGYFTTELGRRLAEKWQAAFVQVQHHRAHFAAVLAENDLFASEEPILGVIWDGTGLGDDGHIWGGEFFRYEGRNQTEAPEMFARCAHFEYFPVLMGDKMAREPRLSALSVCREIEEAQACIKPKFSETEWKLYRKLTTTDTLKTSSMGRIFDAVASLLGLADKVSYEGEAALLLEDLARRYCKEHGFAFTADYFPDVFEKDGPGQTKNLFLQIVRDLNAGKEKAYIAARFHWYLVNIIAQTAKHQNIQKIAFSGGVFQNTLLLDMIEHLLAPDHQLYFHRQLSPNDENISFGQWASTNVGLLRSHITQ